MGFDDLPKVLKNIVCDFAYECKWETVQKDLEMCEHVDSMGLSVVFTRHNMWSKRYRKYMLNPLIAFEPICNYTGSWSDYIDWHSVEELLWRLDFRRKFVFTVANREEWRLKFCVDWRNILLFDAFYRFLLCTRVPCFKPQWKPVGFDGLKTHRSPYVSGRWYLEV